MRIVQQPPPAGSVPWRQPDLRVRIYSEFCEMPGLTLSIQQAARLFSIDRIEIQRLLDGLVDARLLQTDGRIYALAGAGRLCA